MFVVDDYYVALAGEALPRDVSMRKVQAWDAAGKRFDVPVTGTVYATALNDRRALAALDGAFHAAPYHKPPVAPVLYVKPRNTLVGHRARITVPPRATSVHVGASLGLVIGRRATGVPAPRALDYVAGFTLVADLTGPHESFFRLPARDVMADGFCVIGPVVVARHRVTNPDTLTLRVHIGAHEVYASSTDQCLRGVGSLLAAVTDFMTLVPGDVLTLGAPWGAPLVHAGNDVTIAADNWPPLRFTLVGSAGGAV